MTTLTAQIEAMKAASQNQTDASQALAQEVAGKMAELTQKTDQAAQDINALLQDPLLVTLYVSSTGDDMNTGTSASPLLTIKEALDRVPSGGTCVVKIKGNEHYFFQENIHLTNKKLSIVMESTNTVLEQKTATSGVRGSIAVGLRSAITVSGGKIKTLVDGLIPGKDSALFRRDDSAKSCVYFFAVGIELGDHSLVSAGQTANGLHEFALGHCALSLSAERTQDSKLLELHNSCAAITFSTLTNNTALSFVDLIYGVVRGIDGKPINIVTNSAQLWEG